MLALSNFFQNCIVSAIDPSSTMNTNCYAALAVAVMSVFVALLVPTSNAMGICFGGGYPKCCQGGRNNRLITVARVSK